MYSNIKIEVQSFILLKCFVSSLVLVDQFPKWLDSLNGWNIRNCDSKTSVMFDRFHSYTHREGNHSMLSDMYGSESFRTVSKIKLTSQKAVFLELFAILHKQIVLLVDNYDSQTVQNLSKSQFYITFVWRNSHLCDLI